MQLRVAMTSVLKVLYLDCFRFYVKGNGLQVNDKQKTEHGQGTTT